MAVVSAGSPAALAKDVHNQLVAGMMRGEDLYKKLGVDAAIAAGKPELLATVGFGGFLVILWLMVFKPF